jgi:hypothetical protein
MEWSGLRYEVRALRPLDDLGVEVLIFRHLQPIQSFAPNQVPALSEPEMVAFDGRMRLGIGARRV